MYFCINMSSGHTNEPSQCFLNVILWSPVQKLHDHHSVLWKEPIRRWWGHRRSLQNPDFIRLLQPGGPCLTPHSLFYLLHLFPLTKGPTTAEHQYVPLADSSGGLQGDRNQRPACPLSARLIMESVQIFTWHYRVVILMRIQLNPFQASPAASVNRS